MMTDSVPVSMEWSAVTDKMDRFDVTEDQIREVGGGFQVSVGQAGRGDSTDIKTAMLRRGSHSRMFWDSRRQTAYVVLERADLISLSAGLALVFEDDNVVFLKGGAS